MKSCFIRGLVRYVGVAMLIALLPFAASNGNAGKRQTVIDFEGDLVEGMNKRPLDSLNQISERDKKRRKTHLYRKRASFRTETSETLRSLRFNQ